MDSVMGTFPIDRPCVYTDTIKYLRKDCESSLAIFEDIPLEAAEEERKHMGTILERMVQHGVVVS
jgi:hypothetical protein